jgi:hypothetical protein
MKARIAPFALMVAASLAVALAPVASANGRPLKATMDGASEVPGPGATEGSGTARLRLNQGRHRICYHIEVTGIDLPATAAHIHPGAAGTANPPVVVLGAPDETGVADGCVSDVERSLIKDIRKHPADYYVNVHTGQFPDGAIRGQLGKWAPGRGSNSGDENGED